MSHYHNSLVSRNAREGIQSCYKEHQWYEARRRYQAERVKDRVVGYLLLVGAVMLVVVGAAMVNVSGLMP